ncbi:DUF2726 domain-containing protein [Candidatus Minimicrobia naudis]|uniref:DUF2726 domain-containing protein n=1 Tax=Candidatus Minimicrobia naudis TaxID=2841263 RepID=A0A8F1SC06_9BACT|nr:DUF2726 domain-containing protein [Candidatus Minimicrobia naudis]
METLIFIAIVAAIIFLVIKARQGTDDTSLIKTPIKKEYVYIKKSCAMTPSELSFYKTLHEAINGCVIIPQAHLSMFLDHEIKEQSWKAAFARINGKSVDFLICTNDMKPLIAIELDDSTHNQPDRKTRDDFVNSIMANTNMPLLRFKAGEWNSEIIKHRITQALSQN